MEANLKTNPETISAPVPANPAAGTRTYQIGVSRPALEIADLPTPEEVFRVRRIGVQEILLFVAGPCVIGLAMAVGAGEWMLGPLNVGQFGFKGIGWVILVSVVLQVLYNIELARFTLATGEPPVVAFGRVPPGKLLWTPLALLSFFLAFILGGWAVSAGSNLFALVAGRSYLPEELRLVQGLGVGLMFTTFLFVSFGKRIERTLELVMGIFMIFVLVSLPIVALVVVPLSYWGEALSSLVTFTAPPANADVTLLGALAGFAALASGLNFMFIGYYRDKGFGMGAHAGFISGLFGGGKSTLRPVGKTFAETPTNAANWKRWFRYMLIDQWGLFFLGSLVGMIVPSILTGYLVQTSGSIPTSAGMVVFAADELGRQFGSVLYGWALLMGFLILYTTQVIIIELLTRNLTDSLYMNSQPLRRLCREDPRRLYYPAMFVIIIAISLVIFSGPSDPIGLSANLSNFAALIFPWILMYLNSRLPRPARSSWWSYMVLGLNVIFFGFFFVNFIFVQLTGAPLVHF